MLRARYAMLAHPNALRALALLLLIGIGAGCSQDEGDTCQVRRDCADGLICDVAAGSERGKCRSPEDAQDDSGMNEVPDSGGSFGDASLSDAATDDDAGEPSSSEPDSSVDDDAGR